jgi:hypothetical protein
MDFACVQVLFADLQQGIIARSRTNPPEELASSAGVLAEVAKLLRLPIHFSLVPEGGQAPEHVPELAQHGEGVPLRSRMSASSILDEATRDAIAATGAAIQARYQVYVPVDACGGISDRTENAAFRQIEAAGGVTTSVVGLVTALVPDFSTNPGQQAFGALQSLRHRPNTALNI